MLLQDGYFVHFFAPENLPPVPKYTVFVLDTSGSMDGHKLEQMQEAMTSILEEINDEDLLSIVEFDGVQKVYELAKDAISHTYISTWTNLVRPRGALQQNCSSFFCRTPSIYHHQLQQQRKTLETLRRWFPTLMQMEGQIY